MKSVEIAKIQSVSKKRRNRGSIEIVEIKAIEGGVSVYARAWDARGKQIGFGRDGTVDIERFNIYNPPVLVDDSRGDIVLVEQDEKLGELTRRLREDPEEAILQTLEHIISVKKEKFPPKNIIEGKIGSTTSTFFPDADPESTSVDGYARESQGGGVSWATIRGGAGNVAVDSVATLTVSRIEAHTVTDEYITIIRGIFLFDTAAIDNDDDIDSATLSLFGRSPVDDDYGDDFFVNIFASNPASNTSLTGNDFTTVGTTAFSTKIADTSWSTSAYNDFALNASGLAAISKTGVSKFASAESDFDIANVEPTWTSGGNFEVRCFNAEETGTTKDPKLVVEHSAAAAGPVNLKTHNTVVKANIKTLDTVAIANWKTLDTIA